MISKVEMTDAANKTLSWARDDITRLLHVDNSVFKELLAPLQLRLAGHPGMIFVYCVYCVPGTAVASAMGCKTGTGDQAGVDQSVRYAI